MKHDPRQFNSIMSALRRCWSRSPKRKVILEDARSSGHKGPRGGARFTCNVCGEPFGSNDLAVDHIDPVIPVHKAAKDMSWDDIIFRMFDSPPSNLQVVCRECHKIKSTDVENAERSSYKKKIRAFELEYCGNTYNKLLVLHHHSFSKAGYGRALCECECGTQCVVQYNNLKSGHTKSCGCLAGTHKRSNTVEYKTWNNIKSRCYNPNSTGYEYYGGRGIQMCDRWLESFPTFLRDIGDRPEGKYTVERLDVDGDYGPDNCVWASYKEQGNNKSNNHIVSWDGVDKTISEWADIIGEKQNTLYYRLKRGWPVGEALGFQDRYTNKRSTKRNE